ncbi:MAG: hypothetical protein KJ949_03525 [Nanoarchaeota archaeon]|nr:hypothetical protein [Nanoarchaeota archaeon]
MVKLGNPKNAVWEAFLIAIVIFVLGLLLGVAYENSNLKKIDNYYAQSEITMMDFLVLNSVIEIGESDCSFLEKSIFDFADRIYWESITLEKFEDSEQISDSMKLAHNKYDILRTFLWANSMDLKNRCNSSFSTLVYLYEFEPEDLTKRATNSVWSKIIFDLKQKKGEAILLIPIAIDNELNSLESMTQKFNITDYPVLIINNEIVIDKLKTVEDIEKYLN